MTKILIRQKRSTPGNWHVAAQGSEETVKDAALRLGRSENSSFVRDKSSGDVKGDKTSFFVMDKEDFGGGIPE